MKKFASGVAAALVGWLLAGTAVAAPQFVQGPSARNDHAMAYDSARQVAVLFGGVSGGAWSGETWEWNGDAWSLRLPTNSPSPRSGGAMAYDTVRGVCVYFGGYNGGNFDETWEWDGVDWVQRILPTAPSPRHSTNMVYDTARQVCVLFGRQSPFDGSTWEWDGTSWVEAATTGPSPRYQQAMAYDRQRNVTVLFGGWNGGPLDDTWEWDGTQWTQILPATSPTQRTNAGMCYDALQDRVILFGGYDGGPLLDDTWVFDGADWVQATITSGPSARNFSAMTFDDARGECVLFGGYDGTSLSDTWTFGGTEWHPQLDYVSSPFNGNHYALTPPMKWTDAEALAVQEGGHLATVRNSAENAWLVATLSNGSECHWIGLNDAQVEGQFVWSSGEPVTFTNWAAGEPSNGLGVEDWCHLGIPWNGQPSLWNDLPNVVSHGAAVCRGIIELPAVTALSTAATYGAGCGTPALGFFPTANPIIGTTAGALITNAPTLAAGVTMGWSDTHVNGLPILPYDLAGLGLSGCYLLHSNDAFGLSTTPLTASTLQFDFAIPFSPTLLSANVYLQAYCIAPGVNAAQVVTSNGIDWLIGNQ